MTIYHLLFAYCKKQCSLSLAYSSTFNVPLVHKSRVLLLYWGRRGWKIPYTLYSTCVR